MVQFAIINALLARRSQAKPSDKHDTSSAAAFIRTCSKRKLPGLITAFRFLFFFMFRPVPKTTADSPVDAGTFENKADSKWVLMNLSGLAF